MMPPELEEPHQGLGSRQKKRIIGVKPGQFVKGLDGLKGLAILGVTIFHLFPHAASGGFMGVSLFFVLSGYLLAFTTNQQWKVGNYSISKFFQRRAERILIPLVLMVTVILGLWHLLLPEKLAGIRPEVISILLGYNNWWQIAQNADYFTRLVNTSPFTHMWFLGVEIQYIVIWPILFWIYTALKRQWSYTIGLVWMLVLALGSSVTMPLLYTEGMDVSRFYYGTDTRLFALLLGAFLGLHRSEQKLYPLGTMKGNVISSVLLLVGIIVTVLGYIYLDGQSPSLYTYGMVAFTCLFGFMVWLVERPNTPLGKLIDVPLLAWFGKHSYGLFLWQYPMIYLFEHMGFMEYFASPIAYYIVLVSAIIGLTLWSEAVTNWCVRQHSVRAIVDVVRSYYVKVVSIVGAICIVLGMYAFATASEEKQQDVTELQVRLAKNAESQAVENAKVIDLSTVSDPQDMVHMAAIGDSVMLGSAHALRKDFAGIQIDAKVSRYVGAGLGIAKQMDAKQQLGNAVLIGLGTNGPITGYYEDETKALVQYLGSNRQIFWINNYAPGIQWIEANNTYLTKLAKEHPNVHIIDWASLAAKHRDWLGDDGIHPNDTGVKEYSKFIHDEVKKVLLQQEETNKKQKKR